uniref:Transcription factor CBF/NF-Y/archaeal histone domain-containing protein n=1 Tax=Brassica campestris TaxID=3711 RepID=M4EIQ3_BRACM
MHNNTVRLEKEQSYKKILYALKELKWRIHAHFFIHGTKTENNIIGPLFGQSQTKKGTYKMNQHNVIHGTSNLPLSFIIVFKLRFCREIKTMDLVGKSKEDASLPKGDVRVARDAQDLLIECCVEFINLISSESNEVCNKEDKRTIAPEHVLKALQVLGFGEYVEEVYSAYEQHKYETMQDSQRSVKMTQEQR